MHQAKECIWHCIFFQQSFGKRLRARRIARLSISNNAVALVALVAHYDFCSKPSNSNVEAQQSMVFRPQAATSTTNVHHLNMALTESTRSCGPSMAHFCWSGVKINTTSHQRHRCQNWPPGHQWTGTVDQVQKVTRQMSQVSYERCMPSRICWSLSRQRGSATWPWLKKNPSSQRVQDLPVWYP